ncbi:MAG: twin-arginine translocation signal domain-containing protein, partial [Planctomycetes bacterium]|nr:twin-arginine translocation signal domain-containing protein [Planctomycetota bacterium]
MQRRNFLKLCGAAGLGFAVPVGLSSISRAAITKTELPEYDGPYYVVFNAAGGWDTTYLMDPKGVNEINHLYKEGDILTQGNHRLAPNAAHIEAGMSNEDFFKKHGDELLVFNGLDYSVNNHSPCSRYMATGKLDSLAYPTFAALVAACNGPEVPLAFLTFGNYSATGNLVPMASVPYLNSLNRLANA